jgi:hypothetical protein
MTFFILHPLIYIIERLSIFCKSYIKFTIVTRHSSRVHEKMIVVRYICDVLVLSAKMSYFTNSCFNVFLHNPNKVLLCARQIHFSPRPSVWVRTKVIVFLYICDVLVLSAKMDFFTNSCFILILHNTNKVILCARQIHYSPSHSV